MPPINDYKYYWLPLQRNVYFIKQSAPGHDKPEADSAGDASVKSDELLRVYDEHHSRRELICDDMKFAIYKKSQFPP